MDIFVVGMILKTPRLHSGCLCPKTRSTTSQFYISNPRVRFLHVEVIASIDSFDRKINLAWLTAPCPFGPCLMIPVCTEYAESSWSRPDWFGIFAQINSGLHYYLCGLEMMFPDLIYHTSAGDSCNAKRVPGFAGILVRISQNEWQAVHFIIQNKRPL